MTRDGLRRFLKIERPRRPGVEEAPAEAPERFKRVEGPGGPEGEPAVPESATDRFRPPPERPLEVAEPADGEQPFRRCARCELDNARFAEACQNCGADLRTLEQEAFNRRLWASRRAEAAEEAREIAERGRERDQLAAEERRAKVALATEMARMEADRVDGELDAAALEGGPPRAAPGLRLLRSIRNPILRVLVAAVALALPVALIVAGGPNDGLRFAGMLVLVALLGLVAPPTWRLRRPRWWGW